MRSHRRLPRPVGAISLAAVIGGPHPHQLAQIIKLIGNPSSVSVLRRLEELDQARPFGAHSKLVRG
jgi:hypothetical protein